MEIDHPVDVGHVNGDHPLDWKSQKVPDPGHDPLGEMNWPHDDVVEEHEDWGNDAINPLVDSDNPLDWVPEECEWNQNDLQNHHLDRMHKSGE